MVSKPAPPVSLNWKVGFEIELAAPIGVSRLDLAQRVSDRVGGRVTKIFHPESEPSKVPGQDVFENLTPGLRVDDANGQWVANFVDDLTLQADFDRQAKPKSGWYRVVSDDARFLRLVERHCDASAPLEEVLDPLAELFGTKADALAQGMIRVSDGRGNSIAIGAPLPGERERPCEIVTAPIVSDHHETLDALLDDAASLGFGLAKESATHIHFDAKPLRSATFIANFVGLATQFSAELRALVGANPNCVRLGGWPLELAEVVSKPDFAMYSWDEVRATLIGLKLVKYCDFNLVNMVNQSEHKDTLEIRILPGMTEAEDVLKCAWLFEAILRWCMEDRQDLPSTLDKLLCDLPLAQSLSQYWIGRT